MLRLSSSFGFGWLDFSIFILGEMALLYMYYLSISNLSSRSLNSQMCSSSVK